MRRLLVFTSAGFLILAAIGLSLGILTPTKIVILGGQRITVRVASSPVQLATGLSDTLSLPQGTGMLFVFDHDARWQFWMRHMHYPIDILWLNAAKQFIYFRESVSPQTYPQIFTPTVPSRYVLELPSGFIAKYHVRLGSRASFK